MTNTPSSTQIDGELVGSDSFKPERTVKGSPRTSRRNPFSFLRAIWAELRKVIWPTRQETTKYSIVVLFTLILMLTLILLLDYAFSKGAIFLFK